MFKGDLSVKRIEEIISSQGFKIIEFSCCDKDKGFCLIESLGLEDRARSYPCFTAIIANFKYVFIKAGLPDRDRRDLLLHEESHIFQEHFQCSDLIHKTDTRKERQAHDFCNLVLGLNALSKAMTFVLAAVILVGSLRMLLGATTKNTVAATTVTPISYESQASRSFPVSNAVYEETKSSAKEADTESEETTGLHKVYITKHGEKYHESDCRYAKDACLVLLEEAERQGYEPCKICHP